MKTRFGRFSIHDDLIRHDRSHPHLMRLFGMMIIVEARFNVSRRCVDYTAISDLFAPCEEHLMPPEYEMIFQTHPGGQVSVRADSSRYQSQPPPPAADVPFKVKLRALRSAIRDFFPRRTKPPEQKSNAF